MYDYKNLSIPIIIVKLRC